MKKEKTFREELIEIWEDAKIAYAEFEFNCGSDSMNYEELTFFNKKGKVIKDEWDLSDFFEEDVYKAVDFYCNSFDTYVGESGKVIITINEYRDGFSYEKQSLYWYQEPSTKTELCKITKKQAQFLEEYVSSMSSGYEIPQDSFSPRYQENTIFKKDFILTKEIEDMIREIRSAFDKKLSNWIKSIDMVEETEWYDTNAITIVEINKKFFVELGLNCFINIERETYDLTQKEKFMIKFI